MALVERIENIADYTIFEPRRETVYVSLFYNTTKKVIIRHGSKHQHELTNDRQGFFDAVGGRHYDFEVVYRDINIGKKRLFPITSCYQKDRLFKASDRYTGLLYACYIWLKWYEKAKKREKQALKKKK